MNKEYTIDVSKLSDYKVDLHSVHTLNDIYHSTSPEEMQLKIASSGIQLDINSIKWLIDEVAYHAAYWPHTLSRYDSFIKLIHRDKDIRKLACSDEVIAYCLKKACYATVIDLQGDINHFSKMFPGQQSELYYYTNMLREILRARLKKDLAHDRKLARQVNAKSAK